MTEKDHITGLPKELDVWGTIAKEEQQIRIKKEKKRFGKIVTLVEGLDKSVDIKEIAKKLKNKLACGGTVKDNVIELQGNHTKNVKKELINLGFSPDSIKEE